MYLYKIGYCAASASGNYACTQNFSFLLYSFQLFLFFTFLQLIFAYNKLEMISFVGEKFACEPILICIERFNLFLQELLQVWLSMHFTYFSLYRFCSFRYQFGNELRFTDNVFVFSSFRQNPFKVNRRTQ